MKHNMIRKLLLPNKFKNMPDKMTQNLENQSIIDQFWKMWRLNYFSDIKIKKQEFESVKYDFHRINDK